MTDKMDLTELLGLRHRIRIKWAEMPVDDPRLEWLYMRIRAELKKRRG